MKKEMVTKLVESFLDSCSCNEDDTGMLFGVVGAQRHTPVHRTTEIIKEEQVAIVNAIDSAFFELATAILDDKLRAGIPVRLYEEDFLHYRGEERLSTITDAENSVYAELEHLMEAYQYDIDSRKTYIIDLLVNGLADDIYLMDELFLSVHYWKRSDHYEWDSYIINVGEFVIAAMTHVSGETTEQQRKGVEG